MTISFDFSDQVAIVTGAASGIGKAVADLIAAGGGRVIGIDKNFIDSDEPRTANFERFQADITDREKVDAVVRDVSRRHGKIDILVNSAGISANKGIAETSDELLRRIYEVNLLGTFLLAQACSAVMKSRSYGRIVNISSLAAISARPGRSAYAASKGAVISVTKSMALELSEFDITVNAVAPGATETNLVAASHDAKTRQAYIDRIPLRRYATPNEIAWPILFLASREAGYINGQTIVVDGGLLISGVRG